jgi:hypothetical protein
MKQVAALLAILLMCVSGHSEITSRSKDIVIEQPGDLPELAQRKGEAMELRSLGNGTTYLYVEQHEVSRLTILDVTDPAHIKTVGSVPIQTPVAFDFVRSLGDSAVLISYRDNKGTAVMDFRKPKEPALISSNTLQRATRIESIGDTGLLASNAPRLDVEVSLRNYQIIDSSNPRDPQLLLTVEKVEKRLTNPDTGTTFLLSSDGLTVIRQPKVEEAYHLESTATN